MSTKPLELAIASTRGVLTGVSADQLDAPTPCAAWKVSELINHIVGGQAFFANGARGQAPSGEDVDYSSGDFVATFDQAAADCLAAFAADGVMEQMLELPFGQMPGSTFAGLAATDTFTHGWDLAKATGQNTDLAPDLAAQLLEGRAWRSNRVPLRGWCRVRHGAAGTHGREQRGPTRSLSRTLRLSGAGSVSRAAAARGLQ